METSKVIHAIYTDDDVLMSAVKRLKNREASYRRNIYAFSCSWS